MPAGVSGVRQFLLPDLGEGLTEAEIVAWHVAAGDEVALNQVLVDVETEKAVVELPSPYAGTVVEVLAGEGDTVGVGAPIIAIDTSGEGEGTPEKVPTLVGYGPSEAPPSRRRRNGHRHPDREPRTPAAGGIAPAGRATGALHGTSARRRPGGCDRPRPGRPHHPGGPRGTHGRHRARRRSDGGGARDAGTRPRRPEAHGRGHGPERGDGAAGVRVPDARCDGDHESSSSACGPTGTSRGYASRHSPSWPGPWCSPCGMPRR